MHRMGNFPVRSLLWIGFLLSTSNGEWIYKKEHVSIINKLGKGINLNVHCKSKNNDLGLQHIPYQGNYTFYFKPNFWSTTLFFCHFNWKNQFHWFDIYTTDRDYQRCRACFWYVRKNNICLFEENGYCYKWR